MKNFLKLACLVALVRLVACNKRSMIDTKISIFQVGQIWSYKTRPNEPDSRLVINKVELGDRLTVIVHVRIEGLKFKNDKLPNKPQDVFSSLPFGESALKLSAIKIVGQQSPKADFQSAYQAWRKNYESDRAGIWDKPVAQTLDLVEATFNAGLGDRQVIGK